MVPLWELLAIGLLKHHQVGVLTHQHRYEGGCGKKEEGRGPIRPWSFGCPGSTTGALRRKKQDPAPLRVEGRKKLGSKKELKDFSPRKGRRRSTQTR